MLASVLQTLDNPDGACRALERIGALAHDNSAQCCIELQLVQASARPCTQRPIKSLVRVTISQSSDAEAGSDPIAPARDHISTREPAVAKRGRPLVPAD